MRSVVRIYPGPLTLRLNCLGDAGWSSPVARWAHNPKVAGSNPAPATNLFQALRGRSSVWLERGLCKPEVRGSSPLASIKFYCDLYLVDFREHEQPEFRRTLLSLTRTNRLAVSRPKLSTQTALSEAGLSVEFWASFWTRKARKRSLTIE